MRVGPAEDHRLICHLPGEAVRGLLREVNLKVIPRLTNRDDTEDGSAVAPGPESPEGFHVHPWLTHRDTDDEVTDPEAFRGDDADVCEPRVVTFQPPTKGVHGVKDGRRPGGGGQGEEEEPPREPHAEASPGPDTAGPWVGDRGEEGPQDSNGGSVARWSSRIKYIPRPPRAPPSGPPPPRPRPGGEAVPGSSSGGKLFV